MKTSIFFKLLAVLLPLLYSCSSTDDSPEVIYDIEASKLGCRDPFIYYNQESDLYYLHVNGGGKIKCYTSKDLEWWRLQGDSFVPDSDFWGKEDFWAPDMFEYKGRFYMFVTFSSSTAKRGTSILVADHPEGPYSPLVNKAITPNDQMCLDGTLYIDENGDPWLLYCHEWLEAIDGEVCAAPLTDDLTALKDEPIVLFKASQAPWVGDITSGSTKGKVTDAPFILRTDDNKLIMLWSSYRADNGRYAVGQAFSEKGIKGPWSLSGKYLIAGGGHGMLFKNRAGKLMFSFHSPNIAPSYLSIKRAYIYQGQLLIED